MAPELILSFQALTQVKNIQISHQVMFYKIRRTGRVWQPRKIIREKAKLTFKKKQITINH